MERTDAPAGMPPPSEAAAAPHAWRGTALCAGTVMGALAQLQQPQLWALAAYGSLGLCGLLWCLAPWGVRRAWLRSWPWALLAAASLAFAATGLRAVQQQAQQLDAGLQGKDLRIIGTLAAMPQPTSAGVRLRVAVEAATHNGQPVRLPEQVDLGWYHGVLQESASSAQPQRLSGDLRAGERWALTVRLKQPHGARNPQGFDYELWLWEQGVGATGYVRAGPRDEAPQRLAHTWRHPVERVRQAVRDAIFAYLAPDPTDAQQQRLAGVVAALVTGDQRAIERSEWNLFRTTGVAHLMSISGLHITLFAWLAAAAVGAAWRRSQRLCLAWPAPSAALVGGVLLAGLYALFSGWGVPAQRTVAMLATVVLLRLSGRRWPWPQVWLLACAVVALADPWALLQPGFWLSFVAVAALFASDLIAGGARQTGVRGHFFAMLRQQAVVTLVLTPLGLLFFGQVSLVGTVANLLAIPWVTLVVTPLALAGVLWAPLWQGALWAVQGLVAVLQALAAWPAASLWLPVAPWGVGAAAVLGGLWMVLRLPWALRLLGLPLLLPVLLWQPARPLVGQFDLLAADVGQGNAVLLRTATHSLLYDTGPRYSLESDAGDRVLVPLLRAQGERLDMLMLSHRDSDHTGGAAAVLAQQPQARLVGSIAGDAALQALGEASPCVAGQQWTWDGVQFELLHPPSASPPAGARPVRSNVLSCVLRVRSAGGAVALLAGDIEAAQEQQLVAQAAPLRADVLLLPHHGSKTSSSPAFLDAVQPRTALVQAAYRSRFGHPAPEVLARLQVRGIAVVESARCGAALWASPQPAEVRCEREERPRYWQHRW